MKRFVVVAALVLLVGTLTGVFFLPAKLGQYAIDQVQEVDAIRYGGTVWNGRATLITQTGPTADLSWQLQGLTDPQNSDFLHLRPTFAWTLNNPDIALEGTLELQESAVQLYAAGDISSNALAPMLNRFDIFISGAFTLQPMSISSRYQPQSMDEVTLLGPLELLWSGGQVSYILADQYHQIELPSLKAELARESDQTFSAKVTSTANAAKLLDLALSVDGMVHVRLNRRFIDFLAYPWPGEQHPDDIVIEVERRIF